MFSRRHFLTGIGAAFLVQGIIPARAEQDDTLVLMRKSLKL